MEESEEMAQTPSSVNNPLSNVLGPQWQSITSKITKGRLFDD